MSAISNASSNGISSESNSELLLQLERATEASEEWKQERYELQTQLNRAQAVAKEAEVELELLQVSLKNKDTQSNQQLARLQEQHSLEVTRWREKVENLEEMIENMKEDHLKQISQLKQKLNKLEKEVKDHNDLAFDLKVEDLKVENESLKVTLNKKQDEIDSLKQETIRQNKLYQELIETNSELQCCLKSRKEELESTVQCLNELREENALIKQANMVQTNPQDVKKGNSLFAEVEDNRQALKNNLDAVVLKYKRLKRLFHAKCLEVSTVLGEKAALCRHLENVNTDQESVDSQLISSLRDRIKDLENTVRELKETKRDNMKIISNDYEGVKLVESMLQSSSKEIEALKDQLQQRSLNHMLQSELLHKTQRELQVVRGQVLKAQAELTVLKSEVKKDVLSPKGNLSFEEKAGKPQTLPEKENVPFKSVRFEAGKSQILLEKENVPLKNVRFVDVGPLKETVKEMGREISCPQIVVPPAYKS